MLNTVGFESLDEMIDATVPASIRRGAMDLPKTLSEQEALTEMKTIMDKNVVNRSHIGAGYFDCITPPIILRNILENPAFYTPYTPYQAEISQGRLEMLLNFQTMVSDLCALPVANASLLDEATAAAEAMAMLKGANKKKTKFLISSDCNPQTIAVCQTRSEGLGIEVIVGSHTQFDLSEGDVFGVLVQYPATNGQIDDFRDLATQVHDVGAGIVAATDLLALTVLTPPGEWGADVVVGSSQRFGVPMGYGGPHAAFFATSEKFKRKIPGRIIGVSRDSQGKPALRMAMQSREQHIRRDKATSNICTAQALLANVAQAFAVYHGPKGLVRIADKVSACAHTFATGLDLLGIQVKTDSFFDTVHVDLEGADNAAAYVTSSEQHGINLRFIDDNNLYVAFDETNTVEHVNELLAIFKQVKGSSVELPCASLLLTSPSSSSIRAKLKRTSEFLTHPVFNSYHSETEMLRYLYKMQMKDLSLATAMMPLGSCTMKLNATSEMIPITWSTVGGLHPFAPDSQTVGYKEMLDTITDYLAEVTGFYTVSLQPNSGAQGEYAGLMAIQAYHKHNGDHQRNVSLIPTSAHGTNPASAVISGCKVVVIKCDSKGNIDMDDLKAKCVQYADVLSNLMVTYPSTHGVFEEGILEMIQTVHDHGGLVYMDGANLNAQLGLCSPGGMGADVCHLNLHKTFCIPHGGGGPGMGPIGVNEKLAPFLPSHPMLDGDTTGIGAIAAAPFSSASILPISWMYIRMMGAEGLTMATKIAILNANYMASRLRDHYSILYQGTNNTVAHEFILDIRPLKTAGIVEEDIAKRLIDYNFHAPTMSWPVPGTLMVEPTESESMYELDRFCDAMISIRAEIKAIEDGEVDAKNNVLKNSPHTAEQVMADEWDLPYTRTQAAYPLPYLKENKFWPTVSRLDNVYGDRNVVCTCPPIEDYMD